MGSESLIQLCTRFDASYGGHPDLKIHTGSCMSFGYGIVHCKYSKQKLNTNSSTEAEVVGVSDYLTYNIWVYLFMGAQGYDIKQKRLFQDIQSATKMEKNGKKSCTENSKHIDIHCFFDNDNIESNKMSISCCTTEHMLVDFLLNPYKEPCK